MMEHGLVGELWNNMLCETVLMSLEGPEKTIPVKSQWV